MKIICPLLIEFDDSYIILSHNKRVNGKVDAISLILFYKAVLTPNFKKESQYKRKLRKTCCELGYFQILGGYKLDSVQDAQTIHGVFNLLTEPWDHFSK